MGQKQERFIIMETESEYKCMRVVAEESVVEQVRQQQEDSQRYDNVFVAIRSTWPRNS